MEYHRLRIEGGTYFFTVVTHERRPFLKEAQNVDLLRNAFREVMRSRPFFIDAIVILPDHIHCLWTLPEGDADFSTRWRLIKSHFSRRCETTLHGQRSPSRQKKQEQAIWQRRFWEHRIRDQVDFRHHMDYIYYNPVKHGYVAAPVDWPYSSFPRAVAEGFYTTDWGATIEIKFGDSIGNE